MHNLYLDLSVKVSLSMLSDFFYWNPILSMNIYKLSTALNKTNLSRHRWIRKWQGIKIYNNKYKCTSRTQTTYLLFCPCVLSCVLQQPYPRPALGAAWRGSCVAAFIRRIEPRCQHLCRYFALIKLGRACILGRPWSLSCSICFGKVATHNVCLDGNIHKAAT